VTFSDALLQLYNIVEDWQYTFKN